MADKKKDDSKQIKISKVTPVFSKGDLLCSAKFANRKDVLQAVVNDGELISVEEADARLEKFMKGKVR